MWVICSLKAHGIDLGKESVKVNHALLADARLSVELSDTVPPDTTPSTNFWKMNIEKLKLKNTDLYLTHAWRYPSGECLFG